MGVKKRCAQSREMGMFGEGKRRVHGKRRTHKITAPPSIKKLFFSLLLFFFSSSSLLLLFFFSSVLFFCSSVLLFFFSLSSILYPLSSILYPLSSILYPLSSILYPLSSILYPLSSILYPLCKKNPTFHTIAEDRPKHILLRYYGLHTTREKIGVKCPSNNEAVSNIVRNMSWVAL
jgi:hypothetical protein